MTKKMKKIKNYLKSTWDWHLKYYANMYSQMFGAFGNTKV